MTRRRTNTFCAGPGCMRRATGNGLCESHQVQLRRGKALTPLRSYKSGRICTVLGCDRKYWAAGVCRAHYDRRRRGLQNWASLISERGANVRRSLSISRYSEAAIEATAEKSRRSFGATVRAVLDTWARGLLPGADRDIHG